VKLLEQIFDQEFVTC